MIIQFLKAALEQRHLLQFDYDDKPRLVEPHALGLNKKGEVILRAYQVDGETPGWKLFILERAEMITIRDDVESMAPRPGYKAGDKAMTEVFAELPQPDVAEAA
jgi:predicted DNA-binding transcriptional regulator YafY